MAKDPPGSYAIEQAMDWVASRMNLYEEARLLAREQAAALQLKRGKRVRTASTANLSNPPSQKKKT